MNKYLIYQSIGFLFFLSLAFTSCELEDEEIKGSGNITTKRQSIQEFDELDINGVITVFLRQSDNHKVEVVTDDNLHHIVNIESVNGKLFVRTNDDSDYQATKMDVYISMPNLSHIRLDGVTALYCEDTLTLSDIRIEKLNTGFMEFRGVLSRLSVESYDVGDMELHGKAQTAEINNQMTGNLHAYGLLTNNMYLIHGGTGEVEIYASDILEVTIDGVGDVHCKGNPGTIEKTVNGIGKLYIEN